MKGDFSRGHTPDRKRGQKYRRVLLQQGRVLLDSDIAASVDAQDRLLRELASDVGCRTGSPNLGYVVTPGPLFALFATLEQVSGLPAPGAEFRAYRDYAVKLLGRYPTLHLDATKRAGRLVIAGRMQLATATHPKLRIWARIPADVQLTVTIHGAPLQVTGTSDSALLAYDIDVASLAVKHYDTIELGFATEDPAHRAWIGLIEGVQPAGAAPTFCFTAGRFYQDGLSVEHGPADGTWPGSTSLASAGRELAASALAADDLLVAYLEAWERPITAVDDPGILEQALGGALDTTIRTRAIGQVKLARVVMSGLIHALADVGDAIAPAFARVDRGDATLDLTTTPSGSDPDPCAIPASGGYTGGENRLYRFEVHAGGKLGQARLKWSHDNAATLHAVTVDDAHNGLLTLHGASTMQDGELVELLHEADVLGDAAWGQVDLSRPAAFTPATRRAGALYYVETTSKTTQLQLLELDSKNPASIAAVQGKPGLVLRRWSGLCDTRGGRSTFDLGDGITIELAGKSFRVGDYWQYEARRNKDNANGPWQKSPHGPERLFTPLALLKHEGASEPLALERWYEHQYSPLCELAADDIAYDPAHAATGATTVQEALDELFTRQPVVINGCGELIVHPGSDLQAVFDAIEPGQDARVCIHPGAWPVVKTVVVADKGNIVVAGAGRASVLTSNRLAQVLRFERCASVHLHDFSVVSSKPAGSGSGLTGALSVADCPHVELERLYVSTGAGAGPRPLVSGIEVVTRSPKVASARVRIRGCHLRVGHAQVGILVLNAETADITDNHLECPEQPWSLVEHLLDDEVAASAGTIMIGRMALYDGARLSNDIFMTPSVVTLDPKQTDIKRDPTGRPTLLVGLSEWTSGGRVTSFTAHPSLADPERWETLLKKNPMTGWSRVDSKGHAVVHPDAWILANLRRLRKDIVRAALGVKSTVNLGDVGSAFIDLAKRIQARSSVTAGGQGIVVGGRRTPAVGDAFNQNPWNTLYVSAPRSPSVTITGNRVIGFTQGIHLGTSHNHGGVDRDRRLRTYRARIHGNEVHLRVPAIARERHGIFVGNAHSLQVTDNMVELVYPEIHRWPEQEPLDGIRLWGSYGPLLQVRGNHTVGVATGIHIHALNPHIAKNGAVSWLVEHNAHAGPGQPKKIHIP